MDNLVNWDQLGVKVLKFMKAPNSEEKRYAMDLLSNWGSFKTPGIWKRLIKLGEFSYYTIIIEPVSGNRQQAIPAYYSFWLNSG